MIAKEAVDYGLYPVILPFAKALKDMATEKGYSKDKNPSKYREFCQTLGNQKRQEDPDYWVKQFTAAVDQYVHLERVTLDSEDAVWKEPVIISDDCRYLNELNCGRNYQAISVFVKTGGQRKLEDPEGEWRKDISEQLARDVDSHSMENPFMYTVENFGSLNDLEEKVKKWSPLWLGMVAQSYLDFPSWDKKQRRLNENESDQEDGLE